jgi:hypothetical protein
MTLKSGAIRKGLSLGMLFLIACSSSQVKKKESHELSALEGKKVALISVEGEETSRKIVEVALINQLVQKGTFDLVSKRAVETARTAPEQNPMDWKGIAQKAGADYALRAKVLQFEAETHEGYSTETVYDSQLAEEHGTDGKTEQVFKAKSLEGHVQVELSFTQIANQETWSQVAEAQDRVEASARTSSIHLPPKLRFLEDLTNKAFREFFERYY